MSTLVSSQRHKLTSCLRLLASTCLAWLFHVQNQSRVWFGSIDDRWYLRKWELIADLDEFHVRLLSGRLVFPTKVLARWLIGWVS